MRSGFYKIKFLVILSLVFSAAAISAQEEKTKIDSVLSLSHEIIFSNIVKSIHIFSDQLAKAKEIGYRKGEAKVYEKLGELFYANGKYEKSTEAYLNAISIFEELSSIKELAILYGDFGYRIKRRDFVKAKSYLQKGISIAEENSFESELTVMYDHYGVLHEMENNLDSAKYFYQKALDLKYKLNDIIGIPYSLNNLAGIAAMQGNFNLAFEYMRQSDEYRKKEEGNYGRTDNIVFYGDLYFAKGDLDSAEFKFNECLNSKNVYERNYLVRYCYEKLTEIYEKKKDYKEAYFTFKKYSAYKDSVLNFETNSRVAELELQYESAKKDRLIEKSETELREKTAIQIVLLVIAVLLIITIISVYKYQQQKNKRIKEELELKSRLHESEMDKKFSDEKLRIAQELHDNIGSNLTYIISSLDNFSYLENDEKKLHRINRVSEFGRATLNDLRNTVWAMKQESGNLNQLIVKLNELKRQINTANDNLVLEIENNINEDIKFDSMQYLNIFRIIQEALQNVVKHSGAEKILIKFENETEGFRFSIIDNGKGFDVNGTFEGNGLKSMGNRCKEMSANFSINSSSEGTKIECKMKLSNMPY